MTMPARARGPSLRLPCRTQATSAAIGRHGFGHPAEPDVNSDTWPAERIDRWPGAARRSSAGRSRPSCSASGARSRQGREQDDRRAEGIAGSVRHARTSGGNRITVYGASREATSRATPSWVVGSATAIGGPLSSSASRTPARQACDRVQLVARPPAAVGKDVRHAADRHGAGLIGRRSARGQIDIERHRRRAPWHGRAADGMSEDGAVRAEEWAGFVPGDPVARALKERRACSSPSRSSAASRRRGRTPWRTWGSGRRTESPWRWP